MTGQLEILGRSQACRVLLIFLRGQVLDAPLPNSSGCVPGVREHATLANPQHCQTNKDYAIWTHARPMVTAFGVQFSPFVFQTHGGLGDKAIEFVDKLSLHAAARPGASPR